ncbi:hypothetical protein ACFQWH_15070 [Mycolicibacterium sp. GCM10028919]|uniref:hypothetical protein n=1 Tax=Mycolicibacterium sp. GCM10028919 TaxID=3273401 RepID=UPI00361A379D
MNAKKAVMAGLLSIGLAAGGAGVSIATAQADPSSRHVWCPGQPMHSPTGPGVDKTWDMNVCHTWYFVKSGFGNVQLTNGGDSGNVFEGENPPPGSLTDCGYGLFGMPIRC